MYKLIPILVRLGACASSLGWVIYAQARTARDLWKRCGRPDWMLWIFEKVLAAGQQTDADVKDVKRIQKAHAKLSCVYQASNRPFFKIPIDLRAAVTSADLDALERVLVHYAQHSRCLVKVRAAKQKG